MWLITNFRFFSEIASTLWVDPAEAPRLIGQTTKAKARERDLEVLAAAIDVRTKLVMATEDSR